MATEAPKIVRQAKNIKFFDDGSILINKVRISYPHVFEPWGKEEKDTKKYSCKGLLPEATHGEAISELKKLLTKLQEEYFKGKVGTANLFMRNGNDSGKPEQEGCWVVSCSESHKPAVMNRDKSLLRASDDVIYAGCVVNLRIKPWKQANSWGKKVNANLLGVQFVDDGQRFGQDRGDATAGFDEVEGEFTEGAGGDDGWDGDD